MQVYKCIYPNPIMNPKWDQTGFITILGCKLAIFSKVNKVNKNFKNEIFVIVMYKH